MKKLWQQIWCFLGFHEESYPVDSFHHVPTYHCNLCGRDFEL